MLQAQITRIKLQFSTKTFKIPLRDLITSLTNEFCIICYHALNILNIQSVGVYRKLNRQQKRDTRTLLKFDS